MLEGAWHSFAFYLSDDAFGAPLVAAAILSDAVAAFCAWLWIGRSIRFVTDTALTGKAASPTKMRLRRSCPRRRRTRAGSPVNPAKWRGA
jgi:hypothetical protein